MNAWTLPSLSSREAQKIPQQLILIRLLAKKQLD